MDQGLLKQTESSIVLKIKNTGIEVTEDKIAEPNQTQN